MCIIIGKHFPGIGWVAVKNRDRNYVPEISFRKKNKNKLETLYFWDDITAYSEGLNSSGVSILGASLMVLDDEKEITQRGRTHSKDGQRIRQALQFTDPVKAALYLIKKKLTGNTIIFNSDTMVLLESAYHKNEKYDYKIKVIPKNQIVVRTNHGIWLPWAGYQRRSDDTAETASRVSSESRLLIARYIAQKANNPMQLIDGLCQTYVDNPQLNVFRTTTDSKKMRTTAQLLIIPKEKTLYVRPVQSHMIYDFWKNNQPDQQTWVEILSNRPFYKNNQASLTNFSFVHTVD